MDEVGLVVRRLRVHAAGEIEDFNLAGIAWGGFRPAARCSPPQAGSPSFFTAGSKLATLPPPNCRLVYSRTVLPSTICRTRSEPSTLRLHAHPLFAAEGRREVEFMQWPLTIAPSRKTSVPGEHIRWPWAAPRWRRHAPGAAPRRRWESPGPCPMVSGAWQWIMMPLLRSAQAGPFLACSPTKRYSAATM